jgi:hypothetical protein
MKSTKSAKKTRETSTRGRETETFSVHSRRHGEKIMNFEPSHGRVVVRGVGNDDPAGILILDDNEYVFHAAAEWAWPLDGRRYADTRTAELAVLAIAPNHVIPNSMAQFRRRVAAALAPVSALLGGGFKLDGNAPD